MRFRAGRGLWLRRVDYDNMFVQLTETTFSVGKPVAAGSVPGPQPARQLRRLVVAQADARGNLLPRLGERARRGRKRMCGEERRDPVARSRVAERHGGAHE